MTAAIPHSVHLGSSGVGKIFQRSRVRKRFQKGLR